MKPDPVKLFDLTITDLLVQDPYYIRLMVDGAFLEDDAPLFAAVANAPDVAAYLCECCAEQADRLAEKLAQARCVSPEAGREGERAVLRQWAWNLGMAKSPALWDALPWSYWDPSVITDRVDLQGHTVLDVGAGTGQVSLRCAPYAELVYALEPVARLRRYIEHKLDAFGFSNVRTLDGLLADVPLAHNSVDATILSNGAFGWEPEEELAEMERVTRPGGTILLIMPCAVEDDETMGRFEAAGYDRFEFEMPTMGPAPGFIKTVDSGP